MSASFSSGIVKTYGGPGEEGRGREGVSVEGERSTRRHRGETPSKLAQAAANDTHLLILCFHLHLDGCRELASWARDWYFQPEKSLLLVKSHTRTPVKRSSKPRNVVVNGMDSRTRGPGFESRSSTLQPCDLPSPGCKWGQ